MEGTWKTKHHQNPQAIFLSLSNLNPFGLGYLLSGQRKRWLFSLIGNLGLLAVGHLTNASKNPALWAGIFLVVFIGMAVDLWLLLKKKPEMISRKANQERSPASFCRNSGQPVIFWWFFSFSISRIQFDRKGRSGLRRRRI